MELKQVIVVRNDLKMPKGKLAAQVAHGSVEAVINSDPKVVQKWAKSGMKKIVLKIQTTEELLELFQRAKKELPCALITDAGHTQIASGSKTCFACGPVKETKAEKYFKDLKLL